jgi:GTP-binding protein
MRREGFEFAVTRPEVILHRVDGAIHEPFEELHVEAPDSSTGFLIEALSGRKARMTGMHSLGNGSVRLVFEVPTRGLIGFRDIFISATGGDGIMNTEFLGYHPWAGEIHQVRNGALIAAESGTALSFGISNAQERGILFIEPGMDIYEGMVVGLHSRDNDLVVNVCRAKKLTNIRSSTSDISVKLTPPQPPSLERSLTLIADDELVEVTPESIRVRKRVLSQVFRPKRRKED